MLNRRNVLVGIVGAGIIALVVAFLWFVPVLQVRNFDVPAREMPALVNEYRRTWAQIIGGIVLLLGLYATWRRVGIAERSLEATQDQQVTERFTRAIDQLGATDDTGNPRLEIRLGGIYALERIARDSPERDYSTVIEVLAAYVRENAPWPPKPPTASEEQPASESALNEATSQDKGTAQDPELPTQRQRSATDIRAILDVFKRLEGDRVPEKKENRVPLYLQGTDLRGAILGEANLQGAKLGGANLQGAALWYAHLERANLWEAHLQGANLIGANLQGANLMAAHLDGANLMEATGLTQEQINQAYGDDATVLPGPTQEQIYQAYRDNATKLPKGLERPAHWITGTKEQPNSEE